MSQRGQVPNTLPSARYPLASGPIDVTARPNRARAIKQLVGVDVFVDWDGADRDPVVPKQDLLLPPTAGNAPDFRTIADFRKRRLAALELRS